MQLVNLNHESDTKWPTFRNSLILRSLDTTIFYAEILHAPNKGIAGDWRLQ